MPCALKESLRQSMCGRQFYQTVIGGLWVQTFFYGMYLCLFLGSVYMRFHGYLNSRFFAISVILFATSTASIILNFADVLYTQAIVSATNCVGGICSACDGESFLMTLQFRALDVFRCAGDVIFLIGQVAADGLLIYRCFIVWDKRLRILFLPIGMLVLATGCAFAVIAIDIKQCFLRMTIQINDAAPPGRFTDLAGLGNTLNNIQLALSLATNLVVTALIASRIWRVSSGAKIWIWHAGAQFRFALTVIIESGAIICTGLLASLLADVCTASNFTGIRDSIMNQIFGLVTTLIVVHAGLNKRCEERRPDSIHELMPQKPSTVPPKHPQVQISSEGNLGTKSDGGFF